MEQYDHEGDHNMRSYLCNLSGDPVSLALINDHLIIDYKCNLLLGLFMPATINDV